MSGRAVGRYVMGDPIAAGGMATVHVGRLRGDAGFRRVVAIKALHQPFARDPELVKMLIDEARIASYLRHPNVVQTLDVVAAQAELFVVMEYIDGQSLAELAARGPFPHRVACAIVLGVLRGLQAVHEARGPRGEALDIIHRDVSPQNVLVGVDGVARIADFGVAKAHGRLQATRTGEVKGKLAYMAPEQLGGAVTPRTDVFAASILLWEALTGARLFAADSEAATMARVLSGEITSPRAHDPSIPAALEEVVLRGLARDPDQRFVSAGVMADALETSAPIASNTEVGEWIARTAAEALARRASLVAETERMTESSELPNAPDATFAVHTDAPNAPIPVAASFGSEAEPTRAIDGLAAAAAGASPAASSSRGHGSGVRRRALGVATALALAATVASAGIFAAAGSLARTSSQPGTAGSGSTIAGTTSPPSASAPTAITDDSTPVPESVPLQTSPTPRRVHHASPPSTSTRTLRSASCSPDFVVDARGLRHYKPECL